MILAADVGGTKTLLGLFACRAHRPVIVRSESIPSDERSCLEEIVDQFLGPRSPRVRACAVGVAGPVQAGRSAIVNLSWSVDARSLARHLDLDRVDVLNDLEATAWGIAALPPAKLRSLTPGVRAQAGHAGLIAAGTGLGTACLMWDGERFRPSAAEGGHASWAPIDPEGFALWDRLRAVHGRVSVERVCSGPGISAIYDHLGGAPDEPPDDGSGDRNAAISRAALAGADACAVRALDLWVRWYGAAAGDLALTLGAVGGIYVGGGIAPRILPKLLDGTFVAAYRDKGRLSAYVSRIPVRVIVEPRAALLGAARFAAQRAKGKPR